MKTCLIAAGVFLFFSGRLSAESYGEQLPLYYDVATGNITIDTTNISGGEFVSYSLSHTSLANDFLYENHTPFMTNLFSPGSTRTFIDETSWPGEPMAPGVYSLGDIVPAGLTSEELSLSYFGETGRLSVPGDRTPFTYVAWGSFDLDLPLLHVFEVNYSPSPFPPLNDPNPQPPEEITWATAASLLYDPGDGSLFLDTTGPNGGRSFGYQVRLREDLFRVDQFDAVTNQIFGKMSSDIVTEATRIDEGVHSLGAVFPPDLDEQRLREVISSATFIGEPGHGRGALDVAVNGLPMAITIVPEPSASSLVLLSIASLVHAARRRRLGRT